jgi:uncharacterized LabA/DUF88 family protein
MLPVKPTAIVYIDGLNLYRQRLKGNNHLKWLDVFRLAELLFPDLEIVCVKYFSAKLRTTSNDFEPAYRQLMYLSKLQNDALKVQVFLGKMRMDTRYYPSHPINISRDGKVQTVKVVKLEEKGTDVSIAANLVADVAENFAHHYILISNDSDFEPLIELVKSRFSADAKQLNAREFSDEVLAKAQFESVVGRPRTWT